MGDAKEYTPKGGMCSVCVHSGRRCDRLPFHEMQPIKTLHNKIIVKCTEFKRLNNEAGDED